MTRQIADNKGAVSAKDLDDIVLGWFDAIVDPEKIDAGWGLRELGPNRNESACAPKEKFLAAYHDLCTQYLGADSSSTEIMEDQWKRHRRARLYAVYFAYEMAIGRDVSRKRFICYPAHSCIKQDLMDLTEDFRTSFFLHIRFVTR